MDAFKQHAGLAVSLDRANIDTDAIIPKQFLKRIERTGFGEFLFFDWRFLNNGQVNPDFTLNMARYSGASILVTRENFGCGSSREHAPWALLDYGFKVIIAPSFADIFYNNCMKNGILPIELPSDEVDRLMEFIDKYYAYKLYIDLKSQTIKDNYSNIIDFKIDDYQKYLLLEGLDDIALTMLRKDKIDQYEYQRGIQ